MITDYFRMALKLLAAYYYHIKYGSKLRDSIRSLFFVLIYQKQNAQFCYFAENKIFLKNLLTLACAKNIIIYIIKLFNKV